MAQNIDPSACVPFLDPPDRNPRRPSVELPERSCDSHAHVFGPASRYPWYGKRIYTPSDASLAEYEHLLEVLGCARGVLVQPSPYGSDNSLLLDALRASKLELRGIAVVGDEVGAAELERMHEAGIRGVRLNIVDTSENKGVMPIERMRALAERIAPLGWHIELLAHVNEFPDLDLLLGDFPVELCFGHLGYVPTALGPLDPGFQALLRLLADGRAWVKLTAPYRISSRGLPHADVTEFARALVDHAPDRVVWGTDWPHAKAEWPIPMPNDGDLADLIEDWVPDPALREEVLVANPARLYGF
jgi:2-pyrone-4,6-dicarboxylate lactonase